MKKLGLISVAFASITSMFMLSGCDNDSKLIIISENCTNGNCTKSDEDNTTTDLILSNDSLAIYNNVLFF